MHGARHGRIGSTIREGYIRSAYEDADEKLGVTRELMGGNPTTFAGSDHGFAPQSLRRERAKVLFDKQMLTCGGAVAFPAGTGAAADRLAACERRAPPELPRRDLVRRAERRYDSDLTKACWAGGTIQVYISPTLPSRQPLPTYAAVRDGREDAFQSLNDPANPGKQVDPEDHGQGGVAQRRRLRLAPPEPQR